MDGAEQMEGKRVNLFILGEKDFSEQQHFNS